MAFPNIGGDPRIEAGGSVGKSEAAVRRRSSPLCLTSRESGVQGFFDFPDRDVAEIQAIGVLSFERREPEMVAGDFRKRRRRLREPAGSFLEADPFSVGVHASTREGFASEAVKVDFSASDSREDGSIGKLEESELVFGKHRFTRNRRR